MLLKAVMNDIEPREPRYVHREYSFKVNNFFNIDRQKY